MKTLNERRKLLKKMAAELRAEKKVVKESLRARRGASYGRLVYLKNQARCFGIIHGILKRKPDFEFTVGAEQLLDTAVEMGIETRRNPDKILPGFDDFKEAMKML